MYKTISTTSLDNVKFTLRSDSIESFSLINDLGIDNKDSETVSGDEEYESKIYNAQAVTVGEMKAKLPGMQKTKSMEEFFVVEEFFANSLMNLREFFAISNGRLVSPIAVHTLGQMSLSQQNECIFMVKDILERVNSLQALISTFNDNLSANYAKIKSHLRLSILLNVKNFRILENCRAMMLALCDMKKLFEELNFHSVHNLLDEINDMVFDFNSHIENFAGSASGDSKNTQISNGTNINYSTLMKYIYQIESTLSKQSPFINNECAYFKSIINEVKIGFFDFFQQFTKLMNEDYDCDTVFRYEILLFDDHLKTQYITCLLD
ncbi:uncharacterized protein AC631_01371 [Debaryomyces fabryi]|uniref:Uncharacterized protein n=1 Tax=Debaryomyces fabryi TaxID=58627 RepID=A0A0V1Q2X8_9ASCO|nr:uncharacterized protein AC631_01371 [Debaryomyces fabryi]KSA02891.1 hypothetical protein AC631_01371 [Debaryomyces fabryi]CUM45035.1 unnamed protein product [Debaryomyces fabryi]